MSEPYGPDPDDEPVIGANYPPPPPRPRAPEPPAYDEDVIDASQDYDEQLPEDGGYDEPYIGEEVTYYQARQYRDDDAPARQPLFYAFVALAILIGAGAIYLLYSVVANSGDDNKPLVAPTPATALTVAITSPRGGDRFKVNQQVDVAASASANQPVETFQLLVDGRIVDQLNATVPATGTIYTAALRAKFDRRGEYTILVRAILAGGAVTKDTDKIKLTIIEEDTQAPLSVKGKVTEDVNLRTGPSEQFDRVGTLTRGTDVTITGRTADSQWFFIDTDGGRWVAARAIQVTESLTNIPVRDASPTPSVSATTSPTTPTTPTVTPAPTQAANLPDFVPTNAILIDGGSRLRVTVANVSTNAFNGTLVVSAAGVGANPGSKAFSVSIGANAAVTVDFDLDPPVTTPKSAEVRVDPDNAIKESSKANNGATFPINPPAEPPSLSITGAQLQPQSILVNIKNSGGALNSTTVTVHLTFGGSTVDTPATLALAKDQTTQVSIVRPAGSGPATLTLIINGQQTGGTFNFTIN